VANDSADFAVRLHDEVTGPARAMRDELKGLLGDFKKFDAGTRGGGARREKKATDGLREPKMLTPNDRIRLQERQEKAERQARDRAAKEQAQSQKATDRAAAAERRAQEKNAKAQERDASKLRGLMVRDEKAKLASVARQDKAYRSAAVAQQRAMEKADREAKRSAVAKERERERVERKARQADSRRLADMAHDKVLKGGVGAEVKGLMGGAGGGLGGGLGLGSLLAGGAIAAGIGVIVTGLMAVKDAAVAAAAGVATLAARFTAASIEALRFSQSSVTALGNLLHAGHNAREEFDAVRGLAGKLGLNVEDTVHSFQKLLAAQFEVGRAKELLAMGSDLQGIGASADEVSRALLAITQIKSKGRLMASEMLQLQEAGISSELVYEALGKRLGKTRNELAKLQEAGKLDAGIGIDAILAAVRKKTGTSEAGELGQKVATSTLDGMLRTLDAGITNMFIDVGSRLEPIVMPIAQRVIGMFDVIRNHPGLRTLGDLIISRLERVRDWTVQNWPAIQAVLVVGLDAAARAGTGLIAVGDYIVNNWDDIENVLKTVGIMAQGAAIGVGILGVAFASTLAPILLFWKVLSKIVGAMESIAKIHWGVMSKLPGMQAFADRHKDQDKGAKPEKKIAEPGSLQALLEAIKMPATNDNRVAWGEQEKAGQGTVMFGGIGDGARSDSWDTQAKVQPVRAPAQSSATAAPMKDAADAQLAAATTQQATAEANRASAQAMAQAAQLFGAKVAAMPTGGGGGSESSLAGMLEAI
jgi:tape measure domain-containing protein